MRTERRGRRSASLPSLPLPPLSARCNPNSNPIGPALPPRFGARSVRQSLRPSVVAVYLSLSVARRAVAALLTDQSESGGPAARDRERLMQLPVVSPSSPPSSSSSSSSPHSSSSSSSCIANEGFANVGFALARSAAMPFTCTRENSPSERTIPAVAVSLLGRRRRHRRLASHSLTIWFCGSTSRAAAPGHAAVHCHIHT